MPLIALKRGIHSMKAVEDGRTNGHPPVGRAVARRSQPDTLRSAGFSAAAKEKAQSVIASFKTFIEENKREIEAIQLLYSQPYQRGLRYRQVKDLPAKLAVPPLLVNPNLSPPPTTGILGWVQRD